MASIFTALMVGLTLLFLTPLFYYLPKAVLAAMILVAMVGLFDIKGAIHLWKTHRQDFLMLLTTFLVTLLIGIEEGVLAGVLLSILVVLYRSSNSHIAVLGNIPGTTTYRNIKRFKDLGVSDDLLIFRYDNQLYFANVFHFKESIKQVVKQNEDGLKLFILDASKIHDIDSTGLTALEEIVAFVKQKEIQFNLCGAIGPVRDLLFKSGLMDKLGKENQFMKVHDAVTCYRSQSQGLESGWSKDALQTNFTDDTE